MLTPFVGWILAVATVLTVLPIPLRLWRLRRADGVSHVGAATATVTMAAWCGYTLDRGDLPAFASSAGPLLAWSAASVALVVIRRDRRSRLLLIATVGAVALVALAPVAVQGTLAVAGSVAWCLPQLRLALSATPLQGVSAVGYGLIALENAGWVLYAALTGTWAYAIAPVVQGPSSAFIALRALRHR